MTMLNRMPDTSKELIISRYINGIRLIRPEKAPDRQANSVGNTLASPFNVYFLNTDSTILGVNEVCADLMRFDSPQNAVQKSMLDIVEKQVALRIIHTDRAVVKTRTTLLAEDTVAFEDEALRFLTVKAPWYDRHDRVIGVFGCSFLLDRHSAPESLLKITQLGLLHPSTNLNLSQPGLLSTTKSNPASLLTPRQMECLLYIARGKTIRECASVVGLSPRTVEHYVDAIKIKLGCHSRSELIARALKIPAIRERL